MTQLYMPDPNQYLDSLQPEAPKKRSWFVQQWKRLCVILLLISVISVIGYGAYIASLVSKASTRAFSIAPLVTDGAGHTNILILGIGNPGHSGEKLSDTILVMSIDSSKHRAVYISVPRDLRVRLKSFGPVKINQANALGGSDLAQKAVEDVLGIKIQYSVTTNFNGLKQLVDAVGGIDVDVKQALADPEYPCSDDENRACGLKIATGLQHMDGATALQYARCRKGNCGNDFGRAARQQEVIDLVRRKLEKPSIVLHPIEIQSVAAAIKTNMTTDLSGLNLVAVLRGLSSAKDHTNRFVLSTDTDGLLTDAYGSSDLLPVSGNFETIHSKVSELIQK